MTDYPPVNYTPAAPYPNRQLFLCQDINGRLCAASASYGYNPPSGGSTQVFDWLTTPDGGRTFKSAIVPVGGNFKTYYYAGGSAILSRGGDTAFVSVSRADNRPTLLSTAGNRVQPTGSGETGQAWQSGASGQFGTGQNIGSTGKDRGYGEYGVRNRTATKPVTAGGISLGSSPDVAGPTTRTYIFRPGGKDSEFTFCQIDYGYFQTGVHLRIYQSYDDGRTFVRTVVLPLSSPCLQYRYDPRYVPPQVSPQICTVAGIPPFMLPAKEGAPGSGPGLAAKCRLRVGENAWSLEATCGGESADTLYAMGSYGVLHPDTGNVFFLHYLIKSLDCGQSWVSFDPNAPALISENSYQTGFDPANFGYDVQADGSYLLRPYPPIVFPVCGANGLPPSLPSQPSLPQGNYVSVTYAVDTRKPQMVFAHGALYAALPATLLARLGDRSNSNFSVFSYALDAAGLPVTKEHGPGSLPIEAYGWVLVRSGDLGRTWEGLTSPPPMRYGALTTTQNGHRLHWGLHSYSDDGGHTWQDA